MPETSASGRLTAKFNSRLLFVDCRTKMAYFQQIDGQQEQILDGAHCDLLWSSFDGSKFFVLPAA
jgi:hypothetical protein